MAQKAENGLEWLVTVPEDKGFTSALTEACKGDSKVANLLNYFLYAAAQEAKRKNLKKEDIEYIDLKRSLDDILDGLSRHNKTISKKTLISKIVNLQSLEYLQADGYRQTYRVFIKVIEKALANPPMPEKPKLRGIHARQREDCNFSLKGKSTIHEGDTGISSEEMVKLQSQIVDLQSEMVKLQSQIVDLQFSHAQERACREALEAKLASLYSNDTVIDIDSNTDSKAIASNGHSNKKPSQKKPVLTSMPTLFNGKEQSVALNGDEQRLYDLWCNITLTLKNGEKQRLYLETYKPPVTQTMKERFHQLAPLIKTQEEMDALYAYTRNLSYLSGKAIQPGNLISSYPGWRSTLLVETANPTNNGSQPRPSAMISEEARKRNIDRARKARDERLAAEAAKAANQ